MRTSTERGAPRVKVHAKKDFPVAEIRRLLEPGPIVLVSSAWRRETNIMTMGWHTVMEFTPSLVGCVISSANHSFDLIRRSKACVINLPNMDLAETVVRIGNCSGRDTDKLSAFGLTPLPGTAVGAPLIAECHASFECRLVDARLVKTYNFFVFEVVKAHAATTPRYPRTIHYRGDGVFMLSGRARGGIAGSFVLTCCDLARRASRRNRQAEEPP
ncbi:flavin reductase [Sorangium cellulosum]|uniref:Flavin reductase n=1 Tax=Sorangium cellulosum TaxID=56 RepID=A0A2L0EQT5_SORCE|nr:flavin reductase family protein [Sorangium cellulosum]AUX41678.1 flavin reductase [Sorangium cellulosum]